MADGLNEMTEEKRGKNGGERRLNREMHLLNLTFVYIIQVMMILYFLYYDYDIHIVSPSQVVAFMMFLHSTPSVIVISSMTGTL